jgi:hypothetical protein
MAALAALPIVRTQSPSADAKPPAFEVASVKPNQSGPYSLQRMSNLPPGERLTFVNVTLRNLIQVAYSG